MIGVFDSGLGGLTVVKELLAVLPGYDILYFGDTARLPYGNKSAEAVTRFTREGLQILRARGAQILVIACHTASAIYRGSASVATETEPRAVPIFEVVTPSIEKARVATRNGRVGVIGTRATVGSGVYQEQLEGSFDARAARRHPEPVEGSRAARLLRMTVMGQVCPLFVPFIEEGEARSPELKRIAKKYLRPLLQQGIDTLVLACTHYPLIKQLISQIAGKRVVLVDPAHEVARQVKEYLSSHPALDAQLSKSGKLEMLVSDLTPHFERLAMQWLGKKILVAKVETA